MHAERSFCEKTKMPLKKYVHILFLRESKDMIKVFLIAINELKKHLKYFSYKKVI